MTTTTTVSMIEEHHGRCHARVVLHDGSGALALRAHLTSDHPPGSLWHRDDQLDLKLTLHAPSACRLGGVHVPWDLQMPTTWDSPFVAIASWVRCELRGEDPAELEWLDEEGAIPSNPVDRICQLAATMAVGHCDPSARYLALAFDREARMFVYGALVEDWWRRVEQLIGVCPGLFVLGSTVPALRDGILAGIRQGARLTDLVRELATATGARNRHAATLIRRAPRELPPEDLLALVREPRVDINDLPSDERDVTTWYAWCAATARCVRPLMGFVSKHALELEGLANARGLDATAMFREIFDWTTATGSAIPSRRSSPTRILAAIDRWHQSLWESPLDPETRLPPCPTPHSPMGGIRAWPLTTVRELLDEGRRMHHCVGAGVNRAMSGQRAFFRAVVDTQPVTIEVGRAGERWYLIEASEFANRRPSGLLTIHRWVDTLRRGDDEG